MCGELAREVREKEKGLESRVSHLYPSTQVHGPDAAVRSSLRFSHFSCGCGVVSLFRPGVLSAHGGVLDCFFKLAGMARAATLFAGGGEQVSRRGGRGT